MSNCRQTAGCSNFVYFLQHCDFNHDSDKDTGGEDHQLLGTVVVQQRDVIHEVVGLQNGTGLPFSHTLTFTAGYRWDGLAIVVSPPGRASLS